MAPSVPEERPASRLDRSLRVFADVRAGEGITAVMLLVNLFLLLVGYYVLKTVREPLILATGGAELKAYAAAGQAVALMGFIPLYSWFSSRVDREKLVLGVTLFFAFNVELFYIGARLGVPFVGVAFYVWVGIFSLATIAQFWSYANDLYSRDRGQRLFPMIAVGATAGSPVGAKIAQWLFDHKVDAYDMLHLTAFLLLVQLLLYWLVNQRESLARPAPSEALLGPGGFSLVLRSRYLLLIAGMLIVLNIVNTTGEYILGSAVVTHARQLRAADPSFDASAYIGSFYGSYFFGVNVLAVLIQAFLVSRLVKLAGVRGAVLALPLVALGAYGFVALGAAFAALRWAKTAENATDYSVMNTGKQMLWLPTSREEKYKAKQAVDTFFVRSGDLLAAGIVYLGTQVVELGPIGFARVNLVLVALWLFIAWRMLREHDRLAEASAPKA
jgi:ATP:ADP antiporter, AAA family